MNMKLSHVALALLTSTSFYAAAATIVAGSEVKAEADIVVSADSPVGLAITPVANLTVVDIKKGPSTIIARMDVKGESVALHMVNSDASYPHCSWITGQDDNTNKIHACFPVNNGNPYLTIDGKAYYPYTEGKGHTIVSGSNNANPAKGSKVGVDTYKLSLEAIKYTK